jgi:primosomal protein N'
MDHYLSLFFIPLFRIKKGEPFIMCDRCERSVNEFGPEFTQKQNKEALGCKYCGKVIDSDFKFCPHCGRRV